MKIEINNEQVELTEDDVMLYKEFFDLLVRSQEVEQWEHRIVQEIVLDNKWLSKYKSQLYYDSHEVPREMNDKDRAKYLLLLYERIVKNYPDINPEFPLVYWSIHDRVVHKARTIMIDLYKRVSDDLACQVERMDRTGLMKLIKQYTEPFSQALIERDLLKFSGVKVIFRNEKSKPS